MGFVRVFWKNNPQEAYLPRMSISGQIVAEMLAGYTQKTPYKPFQFFWGSTQKLYYMAMFLYIGYGQGNKLSDARQPEVSSFPF